MTKPTIPSHDPRPLPPEKPLPMDCCDSGCDTCVNDLYADEMDHYRVMLAAWKARHPQDDDGAGAASS